MKVIRSSFVVFFFLMFLHPGAFAQIDYFRKQYGAFKQQAGLKYDEFRNEANRQYADFLRKAWQQYKTLPAIPKPKDEEVRPVVMPEEDKDKPIDNKPVIIEEVIAPPAPEPQPVPIAPIRERPKPEEKYVTFRFYGTDCKVRFDEARMFSISGTDGNALAKAWGVLSGESYNNTIRDCLELRIRMNLCDWAYLNLLDTMSRACLGRTNEATVLMAYIYCQSGYKMRLGLAGDKVCLLYASAHNIYDTGYFSIGGEKFYPFRCDASQMSICEASFPEEQPLSLLLAKEQVFTCDMTQRRTLQSVRYPDVKMETAINKNLIDFYNTYPVSDLGDNFMTRWAIYANTPVSKEAREGLYTALKEKTDGLGKLEAAERFLNFVQTAFVYEYDDKVWGHDRAFFAEETLYYPYCDCEDRSILFSHLVRDLLGLETVLVYYPGHLATAVCFDEEISGDYIVLGNKRFIVCDPTYIGASVGMTMPGMDNKKATVILLH